MSLTPGSRIGPYEILAPIGAGGMGEVYRARDTRLGRDVAIRVLPAAVASDPDRLASAGPAKLLFSGRYATGGRESLSQFNLVMNWFEAIKQRAP